MTNYNIEKADAAYKGFPEFSKWNELYIDLPKWDKNINRLEEISNVSADELDHARNIVKRYAAIETGAIEKLYEVNRGFTWTIAAELTDFQTILEKEGEKTKSLIESQFKGYDYILDFATGRELMTEAWIRELHKILCESQETYTVYTPQGSAERPMPKGVYKKHPNHVIFGNGDILSFCPVNIVGAEMHKFLKEINKPKFQSSHPIIKAAYSHYCIVCIHPFSDGNGRVARAIASVFLYRHSSIPFLVLSEDRDEYINSLQEADRGDYQTIVDFTFDKFCSAIDFIEISIRTGTRREINKTLKDLDSFYLTKGGFSHREVDEAADLLMTNLSSIMAEKLNELKRNTNLSVKRDLVPHGTYNPISNDYRVFISGQGKFILVSLHSKKPVEEAISTHLEIHIPKDCDKNDDFIIKNSSNNERITARINEILPNLKPSLIHKLELFSDLIIDDLGEILLTKVRKRAQKARNEPDTPS